MKRYINESHRLVCVEFEGVAQFLRRGDAIETDKKVLKIPKGVVVTTVRKSKSSAKK